MPSDAPLDPGKADRKAMHLSSASTSERAESDAIKTAVISYASMQRYGELYVNFMRARKRVFIDRLKWSLPEAEGMEFDQYDTPQSRLVAVHDDGEILAGVRLSPTTARCGIYSYMLRDAQLGLLDGIPSDVLFFKAPVDEKIWEATRFFISEGVEAKRRFLVQRRLMEAMTEAARAGGATSLIGIVPALFNRWLKRLELDAVPVGPRFAIDGTKSQAAVFNVAETANALTPPAKGEGRAA